MRFSLSLILLILLFSSCKDEIDLSSSACGSSDPINDVSWLAAIVSDMEANKSRSMVSLYSYKKEKVFLVSICYQCPDAITAAYDCDQNLICVFGGFAGQNTCPDFEDEAIFIETLYEK
ncbi:MAG: DUF6970 domain-containing protein [Bacteroidota bacterium]